MVFRKLICWMLAFAVSGAPITNTPKETEEALRSLFCWEETPQINYFCKARPDIEALLNSPPRVEGSVYLYCTHATECYTREKETFRESAPYHTEDVDYNMLSITACMEELLTAEKIPVYRDETLHDTPSYTAAYASSRKGLKKALKSQGNLALVLDIHRDASDGKKQLRPLVPGGSPCAQIMLVVGTGENGLPHPNWKENLALALNLYRILEELRPGINRPLSLRTQRFNQDLTPGALLIEIGGAGNTREEALAAARVLAQAIAQLVREGSTS